MTVFGEYPPCTDDPVGPASAAERQRMGIPEVEAWRETSVIRNDVNARLDRQDTLKRHRDAIARQHLLMQRTYANIQALKARQR